MRWKRNEIINFLQLIWLIFLQEDIINSIMYGWRNVVVPQSFIFIAVSITGSLRSNLKKVFVSTNVVFITGELIPHQFDVKSFFIEWNIPTNSDRKNIPFLCPSSLVLGRISDFVYIFTKYQSRLSNFPPSKIQMCTHFCRPDDSPLVVIMKFIINKLCERTSTN